MNEKFVLLTDDCSDYTDVQSKDIIRVRGGLKPSSEKIKWYTPQSTMPEYYSKWQEYHRMDLTDGKSANDEVLDDGKYNPGTKYVMYGSLKNETIRGKYWISIQKQKITNKRINTYILCV